MVSATVPVPSVLLVGVGRFGGEHLKEWTALAEQGAVSIAGLVVASAQSRSRLRAASASMAMTAVGRMCAAAPCISSSVSSPVRASTPVHRAETGVKP